MTLDYGSYGMSWLINLLWVMQDFISATVVNIIPEGILSLNPKAHSQMKAPGILRDLVRRY